MADEFAGARNRLLQNEKKVMRRCFLKIGLYLTAREYHKAESDFKAKEIAEASTKKANEKFATWLECRKNGMYCGLYSEEDFHLYADLLWSAVLGMEESQLIWWDDALQSAYLVYCLETGRKV
ncbi:MAG: hypothetical protein EPN77_19920 [Candidimonas sp.]|nr:MAG: hypothetical protein EPN77_19920 [Candidimonas sp.]